MSKGSLLQDLSTGLFRMTIPDGTIKLQSHLTSLVNTTSQIFSEVAEFSYTSFLVMCSTTTEQ